MTPSSAGQNRSFIPLTAALFAFAAAAFSLFVVLRGAAGWFALGTADQSGVSAALRVDAANATYHYLLGRHAHLDLNKPDPEKAAAHFQKSLRLNPLQPGVWADYSKALLSQGMADKADYALQRAVRLSPADPALLWEAGTFWLLRDRPAEAFEALRRFILFMPERQQMAYDLAWKLGSDSRLILASLVPSEYAFRAAYLSYLITTERADAAEEAWSSIDLDRLEKKDFIAYMNFLIRAGRYETSRIVWRDITSRIEGMESADESSLVWNSGFEQEMLQGGFGWIIREADGVSVFIDDAVKVAGRKALGVSFDGHHNPGITFAYQVVPLEPGGKYGVRAQIKTEKLTTASGVYLFVSGHNCQGNSVKSEAVTGTNFWKEVGAEFDMPKECRAVVIGFRRDLSAKLDNKIEGTAWIDGVILRSR